MICTCKPAFALSFFGNLLFFSRCCWKLLCCILDTGVNTFNAFSLQTGSMVGHSQGKKKSASFAYSSQLVCTPIFFSLASLWSLSQVKLFMPWCQSCSYNLVFSFVLLYCKYTKFPYWSFYIFYSTQLIEVVYLSRKWYLNGDQFLNSEKLIWWLYILLILGVEILILITLTALWVFTVIRQYHTVARIKWHYRSTFIALKTRSSFADSYLLPILWHLSEMALFCHASVVQMTGQWTCQMSHCLKVLTVWQWNLICRMLESKKSTWLRKALLFVTS